MTNLRELAPPRWVYKRCGRLVPFEADKICRALFAAAESLGRPDAFLARELTDGVVHFLAGETEGHTPSTVEVAEVVVKVVREFREVELARAFEEFAQSRTARVLPSEEPLQKATRAFQFSLDQPLSVLSKEFARSYSLQAVFARDLAAAHQDGLLILSGLESPGELASGLLGPLRETREVLTRLEEATLCIGQTIVLDGPEYVLARFLPATARRVPRSRIEGSVGEFLSELALGLRLTGRQAVLNLNSQQPPPWVDEIANGPLFAPQQPFHEEHLHGVIAALAEGVANDRELSARLRIDWHLAERDFAPPCRTQLLRMIRQSLAGTPLGFVFDRPRRPLHLAEGVQRRFPATLMTVGLPLQRLATLMSEDTPSGSTEKSEIASLPSVRRFLDKLDSLARLALSAGLQKREFLRRQTEQQPALMRGFLLDRARLVVVPIGLDSAVHTLLGGGLCSGAEGIELGCVVLRRLQEILYHEGRASGLETCLDSPTEWAAASEKSHSSPLALGPTCWDTTAPVKGQMRVIGSLHGVTGGGTGLVFLPGEGVPAAEQLADWLRWAWQQTEMVRVRFLRPASPPQQQFFPEPHEER